MAATQLAVDEINASGGILGRSIDPVLIDGKSDWPSFAAGAETLIRNEKVSVVFGCWTSASRKEVKTVVEEYDHLWKPLHIGHYWRIVEMPK